MAAWQACVCGWALAWAADPPNRKAPPTPEELFARIDSNRNGVLSLEEFGAYFKLNPRLKSRSEWENLFNDIDADESGGISREEWKAWAAKAKKRPAPRPLQ